MSGEEESCVECFRHANVVCELLAVVCGEWVDRDLAGTQQSDRGRADRVCRFLVRRSQQCVFRGPVDQRHDCSTVRFTGNGADLPVADPLLCLDNIRALRNVDSARDLAPVGMASAFPVWFLAGLIQRLIHSLRRHWPNTEFLLRADGHYSTPEAMDLCDTLGVDYVFGLPTNSRVRKHVETREADTVKHYKPEFWISSCRVRNAPNDVWDDNFTHFDLGLRENVSRYAR